MRNVIVLSETYGHVTCYEKCIFARVTFFK